MWEGERVKRDQWRPLVAFAFVAVLCAVLTSGATVVILLRFPQCHRQGRRTAFATPLALLSGVFAGLSGYPRFPDHRRGVAVAETRRSERLAMAATEPGRLDPVLAEHAATQPCA